MPTLGSYALISIESGMVYIGSSKNVESRISQHKCALIDNSHSNKPLQEVYNQGEAFVLLKFPTETREDAYQLEQALIDSEKSGGRLLNLSHDVKAPWKGKKLHPEVIEKLREAAFQRPVNHQHLNKLHESMRGRLVSSETRNKISQSHKGVPLSDVHRTAIVLAHKKDCKPVVVNGQRYDSLKDAAAAHNVSYASVRNRANSINFPSWNWADSVTETNEEKAKAMVISRLDRSN